MTLKHNCTKCKHVITNVSMNDEDLPSHKCGIYHKQVNNEVTCGRFKEMSTLDKNVLYKPTQVEKNIIDHHVVHPSQVIYHEPVKHEPIKHDNLTIVRHIHEASLHTCSLELGTPGKDGVLKVYVDPSNLVEAKARIDAMVELKIYMRNKIINTNLDSTATVTHQSNPTLKNLLNG